MPDKPELLPCPFCGQMPELEQEFDYVSIGCGNPNCKMDNVDVFCQDQPNDLITAIAAWNTRADRWIPVSERLPEKNTPVLVYIPHENPIPMELYDGGGDIVWSGIGDSLNFAELDEVTHWMPLPLPPKEVEG